MYKNESRRQKFVATLNHEVARKVVPIAYDYAAASKKQPNSQQLSEIAQRLRDVPQYNDNTTILAQALEVARTAYAAVREPLGTQRARTAGMAVSATKAVLDNKPHFAYGYVIFANGATSSFHLHRDEARVKLVHTYAECAVTAFNLHPPDDHPTISLDSFESDAAAIKKIKRLTGVELVYAIIGEPL